MSQTNSTSQHSVTKHSVTKHSVTKHNAKQYAPTMSLAMAHRRAQFMSDIRQFFSHRQVSGADFDQLRRDYHLRREWQC